MSPPLPSDRFDVRRRLGAGGMGVVYEAFDRRRGSLVALKTLRELDGAALFRFKHEFRALSGLVHPNLVTLYELLSVGDEWVFTMERVEGVHFIEHVRPLEAGETAPLAPAEEVTVPLAGAPNAGALKGPLGSRPRGGRLDVERLRAVLPQLAQGVAALHGVGKLHRDIKPSNVLVTPSGRLVLCDFGLIAEYVRGPQLTTLTSDGAGTPAYMSPEQGLGRSLSEASDWYSVGVVLYEALTGRLPFTGDPADVLQRKRLLRPPPPSEVASDVPGDLDGLCMGLLWPEAEQRLSTAEIFARLDVSHPAAGSLVIPREGIFLGRDAELALLKDAFRASRQKAQVVLLNGPSGMGKTALVQRFLAELDDRSAVALSSRCYETEAMPYKAVDGLVDALTAHLLRLPSAELDTLLPVDAPALARLFPVLRRVEAITAPPVRQFQTSDAQSWRRRAFVAFRELLRALASRKALVLCIDDLQWGDPDSAALLEALLAAPDPPPLLLVGTHRSEAAEPALGATLREAVGRGATWELPLQPFGAVEARRLAAALVPEPSEAADEIAREAGGHPFWIHELARHRVALGEAAASATLDGMLRDRLGRLPVAARALLDVIAVAGRPVERALVAQAAEVGEAENTALALLRAQRLVRGGGEDSLAPYHDRIREVARDALTPEQTRTLHRKLALALQAQGDPDAEASAQHWLAAGDREQARIYAERAAAQASRALAFDRAARLFRLALDLTPPGEGRWQLDAQLGDALANAGRGLEAADAYQRAAADAPPAEVLELRRRAGEQLLHSGQVDRGVLELQAVLGGMGLRVPSTPRAAIASFVWGRIKLAARGLDFTERPEAEVSPIALRRVDLCWSIYAGMSFVNWALGAAFQTHHLRLALESGELKRVARALATEASLLAAIHRSGQERAEALHARARALAERAQDPYTRGVVLGTQGLIHYFGGQWREAGALSERAAGAFRNECTGGAWELDNAELFACLCLLMQGRLGELGQRVPPLLADAQARGDVYADANLRTQLAYLTHLAADDVGGARRLVQDALQSWNVDGFFFQRYFQRVAESQVELYEGDGRAAHRKLLEIWPAFIRNQAHRVQLLRVMAHFWRTTAALGALAAPGNKDARALTQEAEHFTRKLSKETSPWVGGFAQLFRATLDARQGATEAAVAGLARAGTIFEASDMALFAAVAHWRRGELVGGDEGAAERQSAEAAVRAQSVKVPSKLVGLWSPGW